MFSIAAIFAAGSVSLTGAQAPSQPVLSLYFGNGCYWGMQNLFVEKFERAVLGREDSDVTSVAGYAGSTSFGPNGQLCYYNEQNISYYAALGHAEAVRVQVPEDSLEAAFSVFFGDFVLNPGGSFDRPDWFDFGAEYRSMLGFPGGFSNAKIMEAAQRANINGMKLREGQGSDDDTFNTSTVLIMDSDKFHWAQAEPCMQFFDKSSPGYNASYLDLRKVLEDNGRIVDTGCPAVYICDPAATLV